MTLSYPVMPLGYRLQEQLGVTFGKPSGLINAMGQYCEWLAFFHNIANLLPMFYDLQRFLPLHLTLITLLLVIVICRH